MGVGVNSTQRAILWAGAIAAGLMALFPPYFDTGGLYGGVQFAFVLRPPAADYSIDLRPALAVETLLLQLSAVVCFTLAAILAYDGRKKRSTLLALQLPAFAAVVFGATFLAFSVAVSGRGWTEAPFLLCLIPVQYPGGYFLFWLRIAALGLIALLGTLIAGHRSADAARNGVIFAVAAAALGIVGLAAAKAALR